MIDPDALFAVLPHADWCDRGCADDALIGGCYAERNNLAQTILSLDKPVITEVEITMAPHSHTTRVLKGTVNREH